MIAAFAFSSASDATVLALAKEALAASKAAFAVMSAGE